MGAAEACGTDSSYSNQKKLNIPLFKLGGAICEGNASQEVSDKDSVSVKDSSRKAILSQKGGK